MDRLEITITGELPDVGRFTVMAAAEEAVEAFAKAWGEKHPGMKLSVSVKAVRPGTRKPAPIVQGTTAAPEPVAEIETARHGPRHAAAE
jgi:hypothetical protein